MSEDNNDLMAQRIKELRTKKGLSQEQLAELLGLQKSAIAKYEKGRVINIKRSTIANMAEIFHCNPSYIMGWDEEKLDEILEIQKQIHQKYVGIHATLNVVYLDITVDCTKGSGLKKLCSLLDQEVISYCIGDSYNDLDMFEKADHAYTFNRVEKQIKEKTEKQVDYVYEVINDMLEGE